MMDDVPGRWTTAPLRADWGQDGGYLRWRCENYPSLGIFLSERIGSVDSAGSIASLALSAATLGRHGPTVLHRILPAHLDVLPSAAVLLLDDRDMCDAA